MHVVYEGSTRRFDGYKPSANTGSPSLAQGELLATPITKQSQLLNATLGEPEDELEVKTVKINTCVLRVCELFE
ncbi:hypothetical protein F511_37693 [Dorcoceras hygrometricum]|uniref:Uncharacterized protein n=1 Tax=Dorcoceras hygrometricum TaxID=472368 RepID=A0A2Z7B8T7_9LAMI|nr:hypothetical protein F511_37693 [Dorcoceras hygrometricum]